jgi:hypothetical protein
MLAACGGGSSGDTSSGFEWSNECTTAAAEGLPTASKVCADSGLRPVDGGFSFENWGGPVAEDAVTVTTAVAVFGQDGTCARMDGDACVPFPAVQQWIAQTNLSIQGGRCEGMAVLSQRINDEMNSPADFETTATKTAELPKPSVPVAGSISRWWVTQTLSSVAEANARAQGMEPSVIAKNIAQALRAKQGVTLGMYANGMGHAVTPIAVTWADGGKIEVLLYDNNYPGKVTTLTIDEETETWTYDVGAANAGEAGAVWTGTQGSMDYTLMADREGEQKVPWSNDDRSEGAKGSARITVTTGGASIAGVLVTSGEKVVDSRDLASATDGIRIFPSRGGLGTGATVEIPAGLADLKVKPVIGEVLDPAAGDIDLIFAVDSPGPGSVIVRDTVDPDDANYDDFELELSTDEDFESNIDVSADGDIEAGYAFEEEAVEANLEDGQDLDIGDADAEGAIDISITDESGAELYSLEFDGESAGDGPAAAEIDINEETGEVEVTEVPIEAAELDESILEIAAADAQNFEERAAEAETAADESGETTDTDNSGSAPDVSNDDGSPSDDDGTPTSTDGGDTPSNSSDDDGSPNDSGSGGGSSSNDDESPTTTGARVSDDDESPATTRAPQSSDDDESPTTTRAPQSSDDDESPATTRAPQSSDDDESPATTRAPRPSDDDESPATTRAPQSSDDDESPATTRAPRPSDDDESPATTRAPRPSDDDESPATTRAPRPSDDDESPATTRAPRPSDDDESPATTRAPQPSDDGGSDTTAVED